MTNQTNFLADAFEPGSFNFQKPKKYKNQEVMAGKIKNRNNENVIIQFPKMTVSQWDKLIELEFVNQTGYNKKVNTFLSQLDEFVIDYISRESEKWFGKNIPMENVKQMYTPCVKENKVKVVFDKTNSHLTDSKSENPLDSSEIVENITLESICQLKYLIFTKDTCFLQWEICTARVHKKYQRVPLFGFIEDADDTMDSDEEENITFW